ARRDQVFLTEVEEPLERKHCTEDRQRDLYHAGLARLFELGAPTRDVDLLCRLGVSRAGRWGFGRTIGGRDEKTNRQATANDASFLHVLYRAETDHRQHEPCRPGRLGRR